MSNRLFLPLYESLKEHEGKGNFAIKKYYQFPFSLFYRHKLKMILSLMDSRYRSILDFGSGPGIFLPTLRKRSDVVVGFEKGDKFDPRWSFSLVICASVLEFCDLTPTIGFIRILMSKKGELIIASPMDTWISRLYFKLINDKNVRHSHKVILEELKRWYVIESYKEWFGLYFLCKARLK